MGTGGSYAGLIQLGHKADQSLPFMLMPGMCGTVPSLTLYDFISIVGRIQRKYTEKHHHSVNQPLTCSMQQAHSNDHSFPRHG
jgi:hypothetical protein